MGGSLSLLFDVFTLAQRVRQLLGDAMAGSPLTPDEYATYSVLAEMGPLSTTVLARTLGMPVTTAHDYVRAALRRGHADRRRDPRDGRAWLVVLTDDGLTAHRTAGRLFDRAMEAVLDALPLPETDARSTIAAVQSACETAIDVLAARHVDRAG